jgi:hypothetical protein
VTLIVVVIFIGVLFIMCGVAYIADKVATMLDLLRLLSDQVEELKREPLQTASNAEPEKPAT